MPVQDRLQEKKDKEIYARITAPQHIMRNHFSEHQKIEGYFENRDAADFMRSDRLLKLDTLYGTIQLGYNPQKGQSFLFANIKTSIFDTAASRYQRELKEYQMMRALKTGTQNVAYTAKRRGDSAVILYKMENQPWTRRSVEQYLHRINMESLWKTMPFLDRTGDFENRQRALDEQRELQNTLRAQMAAGQYAQTAWTRARQTALTARQNGINALVYRKDTQERLFFRRINAAFDLQKQEMFAYYRSRRSGGAAAKEAETPENVPNGVKDE